MPSIAPPGMWVSLVRGSRPWSRLTGSVMALAAVMSLSGLSVAPAQAVGDASVTFRVLTAQGLPVGGLDVQVAQEHGETSSDGTVTFGPLAAGEQSVDLSFEWEYDGDDTENASWAQTEQVTLEAGANGVVDLRPTTLAVVHGTVTRRGEPVADAEVTGHRLHSAYYAYLRTDGDGRYVLPVFDDHVVRVSVTRKGGHTSYAPGTLREGSAGRYRATAGDPVEADVVLGKLPRGEIRGVVAAASHGRRATVDVRPLDRGGPGDYEEVRPDGSFRLRYLFPATYELSVLVDGAAHPLRRTVRVSKRGTVRMGVLKREHGTVRAVVVRRKGDTARFADVSLVDDATGLHVDGDRVTFARGSRRDRAKVRIRGVAPGRYRVVLTGDGVRSRRVRVEDGKVAHAGRLVRPRHRAKVAVKVVTGRGVPLTRAAVYLVDRSGTYRTLTRDNRTRRDGTRTIKDVAPGRYRLYVAGWKVRGKKKDVRLGRARPVTVTVTRRTRTARVTVVLTRCATAHGKIVDEHGDPVTGMTVIATSATPTPTNVYSPFFHGSVTAKVRRDGTYRLKGLAPGATYRLTVRDSSGVYPDRYVGAKKLTKQRKRARRFVLHAGQKQRVRTMAMPAL